MSWSHLVHADRNAHESREALCAVAPSLLACDFAHLADEIAAVEREGVEFLHLDVMDGHFVRNITFGPPLVQTVARVAKTTLDTHLMSLVNRELISPDEALEKSQDPNVMREKFQQLGLKLRTL